MKILIARRLISLGGQFFKFFMWQQIGSHYFQIWSSGSGFKIYIFTVIKTSISVWLLR